MIGPPKPVKDIVKAGIARLKRIDTDQGAFIHPTVVRSGDGAVYVGRDARVGRRSELHAHGGTIRLAPGVSVRADVKVITYRGGIDIGEAAVVVSYSMLYGGGGITVGKRVLIGNHCVISGLDHTYPGRARVTESPMREAPVVIGDDVWIGAFSLILAGVTVGEGAIVGSHSLVREDVPPYTVVAGQPARVIRDR